MLATPPCGQIRWPYGYNYCWSITTQRPGVNTMLAPVYQRDVWLHKYLWSCMTDDPTHTSCMTGHDGMETLSTSFALCEGKPPIIGNSPHKRPVMCSLGVFFSGSLKKLLNILLSCWWFEMVWHSCDVPVMPPKLSSSNVQSGISMTWSWRHFSVPPPHMLPSQYTCMQHARCRLY